MDLRQFLLALVLLSAARPSAAQSIRWTARTVATGGAGVAVDATLNPAIRAESSVLLGMTRLYGLSDLDVFRMSGRFPLFSVDLAHFGMDGYHETLISASLPIISGIGVRATGSRRRIGAYAADYSMGLDIGFESSLSNRWRIGAVIEDTFSRMNRVLSLGVSTRPAPDVTIMGAVIHEPGYTASWRFGFEWMIAGRFTLRAGSTRQPTRMTTGFGLRLGSLRVDIARDRHHVLGWTTSTEVAWLY